MTRKILITLFLLIILFFSLPGLMNIFGVHTTRVLIFNGNEKAVQYRFNGEDHALAAGEVNVFVSSRFRNKIVVKDDEDGLNASFGSGQYVVNLGPIKLRVKEKFYRWDDKNKRFYPREIKPKDRILYDKKLKKGIHIIDDCWDCCILLPPHERPYRFLKEAFKDKRIMVTNRPMYRNKERTSPDNQ